MSTLGDPLTDIGMMFVYWPEAGEERASTLSPVTTLPGFPTRHEVAERYAQRTGADLSDLNWYVGFAFFKFAAIIAGHRRPVGRRRDGRQGHQPVTPSASTRAWSWDAPRWTTVPSRAASRP